MVSTKRLKGFNANAPVTNSDLNFQQQSDQEEFLERMRLVFGHPQYVESSWGIIASSDPASELEGSTAPLVVSADSGTLTISVNAGYVLTKSGFRVHLITAQVGLYLASSDTGVVNFVTLKYFTAKPDSASTSDFLHTVYKQRIEPDDEDKVAIYTLAQWNNLSQNDKDDHVVIAAVTPQIGSSGSKELLVDLTQANYSFNRPWFSPVDIAHRSSTGSGTVSTTNPHGISFNELNVGNFTLPSLMLQMGMIAAQPQRFAHTPGRGCQSTLPIGNQKTDSLNTYGSGATAKYYELPYFPVRLGRVAHSANLDEEFAFRVAGRTNVIVQSTGDQADPTGDVQVEAVKVLTLEPKVFSGPVSKMEVSPIQSSDLVIAGGKAYTSESTVVLSDSMGDAGPLPMRYNFYFQDGQLVKNPQVLVCRTLLSDVGSGITPTITQFGDGVALIVLDKAAAGVSLSVKVRVTGKDEDGVDVTELFSFDSSWAQGPDVPNCATPMTQLLRGSTFFSEVTGITLEESLNAGDDAAIQVYIVMHTTRSSQLRYACPVANTIWDGTKFCDVKDARTIAPDTQSIEPDAAITSLQAVMDERLDPVFSTHKRRVALVDSFRNPLYSSLVDPSLTDWGLGQGVVDISPSDGAQPGIFGFYQSRAIPLIDPTAVYSVLSVRMLPTGHSVSYPGLTALDRFAGTYPNFPIIDQSYYDGSWSAWSSMSGPTAPPTAGGPIEWTAALSFGVTAFRLRVKSAYGFWGFIAIQDWSS